MTRHAVIAVIAVGALAACRAPSTPEVALLLADRAGAPAETREFGARARALGLETLALTAPDLATQTAQLERVLAGGAKVVVIEPIDAAASAGFVARAHERGARVVAYDHVIASDALDAYVSHDSYRVGVLQAEAALAATGGKGRYVLLAGPADQAMATEITRGYEHTLAPYVARGDVEIVLRRHHAGAVGEAARTVEVALARGAIDVVLANRSVLAREAIDALEAAGAPPAFVAGADADVPNLNLVCQGRQAVEVLKPRGPLARTAADTARRVLRGDDLARDGTSIEIRGRHVQVATVRVALITADLLKPLVVDPGHVDRGALPACAPRLVAGPTPRSAGG